MVGHIDTGVWVQVGTNLDGVLVFHKEEVGYFEVFRGWNSPTCICSSPAFTRMYVVQDPQTL